jgi:hypothetical protein
MSESGGRPSFRTSKAAPVTWLRGLTEHFAAKWKPVFGDKMLPIRRFLARVARHADPVTHHVPAGRGCRGLFRPSCHAPRKSTFATVENRRLSWEDKGARRPTRTPAREKLTNKQRLIRARQYQSETRAPPRPEAVE